MLFFAGPCAGLLVGRFWASTILLFFLGFFKGKDRKNEKKMLSAAGTGKT
jgi:hypothetical protein